MAYKFMCIEYFSRGMVGKRAVRFWDNMAIQCRPLTHPTRLINPKVNSILRSLMIQKTPEPLW